MAPGLPSLSAPPSENTHEFQEIPAEISYLIWQLMSVDQEDAELNGVNRIPEIMLGNHL
jgi:hypothetical protein